MLLLLVLLVSVFLMLVGLLIGVGLYDTVVSCLVLDFLTGAGIYSSVFGFRFFGGVVDFFIVVVWVLVIDVIEVSKLRTSVSSSSDIARSPVMSDMGDRGLLMIDLMVVFSGVLLVESLELSVEEDEDELELLELLEPGVGELLRERVVSVGDFFVCEVEGFGVGFFGGVVVDFCILLFTFGLLLIWFNGCFIRVFLRMVGSCRSRSLSSGVSLMVGSLGDAVLFRVAVGFAILKMKVSLVFTPPAFLIRLLLMLLLGLLAVGLLSWTVTEVVMWEPLPLAGGDEPFPVSGGIIVSHFEFNF